MEKKNQEYWSNVLHEARIQAKPIPQISHDLKDFSRADAYSIQEMQMGYRIKTGEKQLGWKMGLTSEAKRKQMNLDSPLYGFLMDQMQIPRGGVIDLQGTIHPKIEPEIAFLIAQTLSGSPDREQVLNACGGVACALEILDSRYEQFKYFSMEDVIADNSSSSHFVLGPWVKDFRKLDLLNLKMEMLLDDVCIQRGVSKDISGDPVISIIQLCKLLAERGQTLAAGSIVLAGAATLAESLKPGQQIKLIVEHLPSVSVSVKGE